MNPPRGYVLGERQQMADVLAAEAELLRSEGVDPTWPGFDERREDAEDDDERSG